MSLFLSMRCFCFFAVFLNFTFWEIIAQDKKKQSRREQLMLRFEKKDCKLDEEERDDIRNFLSRLRNAESV